MKKRICAIVFSLLVSFMFSESINGFFDIPFGIKMSDANKLFFDKGYYPENIKEDGLYKSIDYKKDSYDFFLNIPVYRISVIYNSDNELISFMTFAVLAQLNTSKVFLQKFIEKYDNLELMNYSKKSDTEECSFTDKITNTYVRFTQTLVNDNYAIFVLLTKENYFDDD